MPDDASPENEPEEFIGEALEVYTDSFLVSASTYTVILHFGMKVAPKTTKSMVDVRMSPEHAKMMAILFRRTVKEIEATTGQSIALPQSLLESKNINLTTDW